MHQTAPCRPHIIAYWKALPRWKHLVPVVKIARTFDELRLAYSPNPKHTLRRLRGPRNLYFSVIPRGLSPKFIVSFNG